MVSHHQVLFIFISYFLTFPMIGSRNVGSGISVVSSFESSDETKGELGQIAISTSSESEETDQPDVSSNVTVVAAASTPCALVTMSLLDGRDGKLVGYDDKTLISVSHETFDVSQGIVPTIVYQVTLEIPSGHEFSLEYWLNGLTEEKVKQKRRHQRDRRDTLLELYPDSSVSSSFPDPSPLPSSSSSTNSNNNRTGSFSDPFVFCGKSSLAGVNRQASGVRLKFHWYINANKFVPQASVSGIPSNVIFRLRFRSVVEATTSVFEQNLSIIVREDCYLQLKVEDKTKLTLGSLMNSKTDNTGLNCTVFIVSKKNFGLEINLSSLSVYGMRDICKGRYLQFTRPNRGSPSPHNSFPIYSPRTTSGRTGSSSTVNSGTSSGSDSGTSDLKHLANNNDNVVESFQEFSQSFEFSNNDADNVHQQQQQYSPLESKFCGKLEDYAESERTLTFPSPESTFLSSSSSLSPQTGADNEIHTNSENMKISSSQQLWGVYLTIRLPVTVKARESFAFDLIALSPCQRVTLNGLDGQLQYSKHYENDQCSVVIHVPYGNTILAQIAVSSNSESYQERGGSDSSSNNNSNRNYLVSSGTGGDQDEGVKSDISTSVSGADVLTTARNSEGSSKESLSERPEKSSSSSGTPSNEPDTRQLTNNVDGESSSVSSVPYESTGVWTQNTSTRSIENETNSDAVHTPSGESGGSGVSSGEKEGAPSHPSGLFQQRHNHNGDNNNDVKTDQGVYEEDIEDNSLPISTSSYECPTSVKHVEESNDINSGDLLGSSVPEKHGDVENESSMKSVPVRRPHQMQAQHKYLLIQAVDLVSGSEFNWCFDAGKQNSAHKRAWKSSGNRVSINFRMSHFQTFSLTYQSVKIPELVGDCERGWVKVDGTCVTLVEKLRKWTDAEESCQIRGGHLVTVKNEQNENKLEKLVTESPLFHPSRAYWVGANDRESEGNFQWTSGLPFQFKNWFPGWTHQSRTDRSEILSAQPNDDGWSGQDCVEIRQIVIPPSTVSAPSSSSSSGDNRGFAPFSQKSDIRSSKERWHASQYSAQGFSTLDRKFYWNDRNCEVKNFYLCEKGTHQNVDVSCNRTLKLSPPQVTSVVVTSPGYPSAYRDNMICVTSIETVPGFKLVLSFDEFILEESLGCQYDSLEIIELHEDPATQSSSGSSLANQGTGVNQQQGLQASYQQKASRANPRVSNSTYKGGKICGDWTKKLKLLRYTTASKSTKVILKFESDFSHHFPGFKVKVTTEKDMEQQCMEQQMQRFGNHCYLLVSFPAVSWTTAHHICETLKGNLASILSTTEWGFLTRTLLSAPGYDKKSIYWLGGSIDKNNQLGWVDHMPFNFSGFHPSDLQTRSDFRCLSIYWHEGSGGSKGDLAWRLTECSQTAGYVCKKKAEVEMRQFLNRTFSGTGGKLASPNYPSNYVTNMDNRNHLVAPRGTQIVIRFSHLDVEPQEDCLYDYVEIVDQPTRNGTRYCGTYTRDKLSRLDYVSSSNEVDVIFHTDFSNTFTGYELLWRAVDVTSCTSGKTIMAGFVGSPFPLGDQTIHTPNFPYFNLPHLDCVYHIIAPAGQRLWLSFQVFELGRAPGTSGSNDVDGFTDESFSENTPWTGTDCLQQDHVSIDLTGDGGQYLSSVPFSPAGGKFVTDLANDNEILICGNLSSTLFRASFISSSERLLIRVRSPQGHTGRGFLGRFKAIPHFLTETLTVNTQPNSTISLTSLNFPLVPPPMANLTVSFIAPPQYVIILKTAGSSRCPQNTKSYLEVRDPYVGMNGLTKIVCHLRESNYPSYTAEDEDDDGNLGGGGDNNNGNNYGNYINSGSGNSGSRLMKNDDIFAVVDSNTDSILGHDNAITPGRTIQFRSRFNRLDVKQVYLAGLLGKKWNAQIITTLDENFREEILANGDRLLLLNACSPNPCSNGGICVSDKGRHICRCPSPFTGPFCALSVCDVNPCLFGECIIEGKSFKCGCHPGYGGERCQRRYKPCDDRPCSGHGDCSEVNKTSYECLCHAWWEGPQCESRMLHIPYKPLSQRMLEEPFWLGLITVFVVMGVIGLIWCLKRHFPEKLEKFLSEDLERNRGISWAPSSVRTGGVVGPGPLGMRDAIPGTSQQAASPPTARSFLGRLGIRKPSLLSLSSATSNVSATVASPHTYENRTFSLDDLLRPSRGMLRTPSPHRRRNYSVQVRRDPAEKQQILQQLVSPGPSSSFDGESKPATPKPTLAEIIQMSEKRLRLASQSSMTNEPQPSTSGGVGSMSVHTSIDSVTSHRQGADSAETSFTTIVPPSTAAAIKAEKKVTFAHMLDKLAAGEMTSSSSCSDVSCGEESKIVVTVPPKPVGKKDRKGRFRRSKPYRSRTSEEDGAEISSSDTTPDPMFPPRFPLRICISPTSTSGPSICTTMASSSTGSVSTPAVPTSLSAKPQSSSGKLTKIASADSLLSLFRRFSGSGSAPPSPQYSENEESSAGATPLSTPSSPRNSALNLRPPALMITSTEPSSSSSSSNNNNTIELPVIDPFSLGPAPGSAWNRSSGGPTITLEVPMRDYCLSPIHEVPTPLPTPSHSPAHSPMMRRPPQDGRIPMIKVQSSEDDDSVITRRGSVPENNSFPGPGPGSRKLEIPLIAISVDECDDDNEEDKEDDYTEDVDGDDGEHMDCEREKLVSSNKISATRGNKRKKVLGEPEHIPDVLINVPPDASLESKPEYAERDNVLPSTSASVDMGMPLSPTSSAGSQGMSKPRPPLLVFANEILSCGTRGSKEDNSSGTGSTSSSTNSSCCSSTSSYSSTNSNSSSTSSTNSSCGSGGCGEASGNGNDNNINNNNSKTIPNVVPLLNIEYATPVSEALPKFITSPEEASSISDKAPVVEVVSCLAIRHIWDCQMVPPMITINHSEAESDSDTTLAKSIRRPNLNFLSPFACDTNRVPSESNLSTSGYSSMASPCVSRCPSVSPLCPSEMDDYHACHHSASGNPNQHLIRRASLTPGTPKPSSPMPRRSSLNSVTPLMSFSPVGFHQKRSLSEEKYEEDKKKLAEVEMETDSAVEVETDMECQSNTILHEMTASNNTLSPPEEIEEERRNNGSSTSTQLAPPSSSPPSSSHSPVPIFPEELKCINSLLQVPRKGFPKSRSLDINSTMIDEMPFGSGSVGGGGGGCKVGGIASNPSSSSIIPGYARNQQLKALGPSLDSKLNSIEPFLSGQKGSSTTGITISLPLTSAPALPSKTLVPIHSTGNLIEIPDENKDKRLSPVSSRSESPLSELSAVGRFTACPGSPVTDSDGMYDCPSSEVPSNNNDHGVNIPRLTSLNRLSPQQQLRRSGRRKDRRLGRNRPSLVGVPNAPAVSNNNNCPANTSAVDLLPPPLIPSPVAYCSPAGSIPSSTDTSKFVLSPATPVASTTPPNLFGGGEMTEGGSPNRLIFPYIDLPPNLARESLVPVGAISKRASPKRRVRAQPALDASSSSSESLSSRSRSRTSVSSFHHSCGSPKRSLEEVEGTYALSDSAIGTRNSTSGVVSSKPVAKADLEDDRCIPSTSIKAQELSPKPDVIQQQPTSSVMASLLPPRSQDQSSSSSPARRKISRLRTISHQIRFLRRLELSLIRKKECLTAVSRPNEILIASNRRDSILGRSDSWDTSREEDISDSTDSTSENHSDEKEMEETEFQDTKQPLIPRSSSSPGTLCLKGTSTSSQDKPKKSGSSSGSSSRMINMDLLDNCSATELLSSHKRKLRKY